MRGFESLVIKGTCLSKIERSVKLWLSSNAGSDVEGCRIRSDKARSLLNSIILMFLVRRKVYFKKWCLRRDGGDE